MYRFWDCSVLGCSLAAAIDIGSCERCQSWFCAEHVKSAYHTCDVSPLDDEAWLAAQTRELIALREKTNAVALLQRAKQLSGGKECHLGVDDVLGRSLMGGMHVHYEICFDDGTVWLARILRENHTSFNDQLSNEILLSECATLQWLEPLDIPTPRLHGYGLRGDSSNEVGVAYMLIDKLPGTPFNPDSASPEQKTKVLGQWADTLCTLGQHPFKKLGSLTFDGVGPVASDRTGTLPPLGPFSTARDLYSSWAKAYLDLIANRQLFSPFSVDAYLVFDHLLSSTRDGQWFTQWERLDTGPFFLKHTDDKGDHILVDDDFNVTGIIDWTFARVVPAYEAFGPSLISADNSLLFDGKVGLSADDVALGKQLRLQNSPYIFYGSDELRRFLFGLGMGLGPTKEEATGLFAAIVATFEPGHAIDWPRWKEARLRHLAGNPQLSALIQGRVSQSVPRFATCSTSTCRRPSVRGRSCQTCESHICAIHALPQFHHCASTNEVDDETWESGVKSEVDSLLASVDVPKLVELASSLRQGLPCRFCPGKYLGQGAIMGCANYHAEIVFDDEVRWLVRIPRTTSFSDMPLELVEYLVKSEYATLKWLERLSVPTPKAYAYGLASDPNNLVGVSFLLEHALPGRPFYAHEATEEQKSRVYEQYARFLLEIRRHPATQACSLVPTSDGVTKEGPIASNRFLNPAMHGPFQTAQEYLSSMADIHLQLISDGQIYPKFPKEAYVFYRLLKQQAAPTLASISSSSVDGFFLKHVDDKGDHILVDDDYNITGIIDWQFARFAPACEAFGPSLFTADLDMLYGGTAGLGQDDRLLAQHLADQDEDGEGISDFANGSDLARRFQLGLASGLGRDEVLGLSNAVLALLDSDLRDGDSSGAMESWIDAQWAESVGEPWFEATRILVEELEHLTQHTQR